MSIALMGVLSESPNALCVRWLVESGIDIYPLLFWKLAFCGAFVAAFALHASGGPISAARELLASKRYATLAAFFQCAANVFFTVALATTSAAHTILLVSLNPLWAALLGRIFLGDRVDPWTLRAMGVAIFAVAFIFLPELFPGRLDGVSSSSSSSSSSNEEERATLRGDVTAVVTGFCIAGFITTMRKIGRIAPEADMTFTAVLGGWVAAIFATGMAKGRVSPRGAGYASHRPLHHFYLVVAADGIFIAGFNITLSVAPRLCSGPEVGLILLLEVVLGPLWIFFFYGSVPGTFTLIGGFLLISTLALHELALANRRASVNASSAPLGFKVGPDVGEGEEEKEEEEDDDDDDDEGVEKPTLADIHDDDASTLKKRGGGLNTEATLSDDVVIIIVQSASHHNLLAATTWRVP